MNLNLYTDNTSPDEPESDEFAPVIVTQSPRMHGLIATTRKIAKSTATVLLTGESGTGKELFAMLTHANSNRSRQPFVRVNCAALADNLIESELFGHERGAFTDAIERRIGRFESADQGTILLDEVTEIPLSTQAKLLRVLESNEYQRVGSNNILTSDTRVIATSNRDLRLEVKAGRFRLDLYHRLNVMPIRIPSLRERTEDIPLLVTYFVSQFRQENEIGIQGFCQKALLKLANYDWPGNVRELKNVVHRACLLTQSPLIDESCIAELSMTCEDEDTTIPVDWLNISLAEIEKRIILAAMNKYGSQRLVAETLGVSTRTLSNKMRSYRESDSDRKIA